MTNIIQLRDVSEADLPIFFEQQRDPVANHRVAFTAENPDDRDAFLVKWARILGDDTVTKKTILFKGEVAGNVLCFLASWSGQQEVGYWLGREYWGQGIATQALTELLETIDIRPLYARAARDNLASIRVLTKCGFTMCGYEKGFANARGKEIEGVILKLGDNGAK
jgi:RimJ/RimL family protein N-acetyltransferase